MSLTLHTDPLLERLDETLARIRERLLAERNRAGYWEGELSTSSGDTQFPSTFTGARDGLEAGGQYYLGARAGFALTPGIAAYGKIGYTALDTKAFTSAGTLADVKENAGGLRYGGGLQVQLPGPLEARLEYRRSRYKDVADGTYGDLNTDQVVAGVGLRF